MANSVVQKKQAQKFLRLIRETLVSYEYEPLSLQGRILEEILV
jgi:hypothetical protein